MFLFTISLQQLEVTASSLTVKSEKDMTPIFDNRGGVLSEIGFMRLGEPLIMTQDYGKNWWQVKFGNAFGYVHKASVSVEMSVPAHSTNNQVNSNIVVHINKDTDVYDNSSGKLKKFAVIKSGYRYPVIDHYGNWWKIDVGGRTGYIHKSLTSIDNGIPVLMYHHILTVSEKANSPFAKLNTTITDIEFNEQMDFLKENGFTTISTKDLEGYLNHQLNLPARVVVITIDDGNISSRIYAYPKLKEHGFTADQFIITNRTPNTPKVLDPMKLHFLSKQEMDEMKDVYNYYAHSHDLHFLTNSNQSFVTAKSKKEVVQDLLLNRRLLEDTTYFAYPFGQYNKETLKILQEVGFSMAYTINHGRPTLGSNKLLLPRIGIEPTLSIEEFAKKVY